MQGLDGSRAAQNRAHLVDDLRIEARPRQVHVLQSRAVLDDLSEHKNDITSVLSLLVLHFRLHYIVPGQVQTSQAPVLFQNVEQRLHLRWSELIPADVEGLERLLSSYNFTQMHHAEVVETGFHEGKFAEVVPLAYLAQQLLCDVPRRPHMD